LAWAENRNDARRDRNGEDWLIGALIADWARQHDHPTRIVFDVGANRGDFTAATLAAADAAGVRIAVYAFEPNPSAFPSLSARFAGDARVTPIHAAVADFEGTAPLFDAHRANECASLVKRDPRRIEQPPAVAVTTLASAITTYRIPRIDFLKLDIEGAELEALRGLGDRLDPARIPVILFEYGGTTLDAGHRLRDFFDLLTAQGYHLTKLFPAWLERRSYLEQWDNFNCSNWVAVAPMVDA
jgi:FkbM family methyltransferase